MDWLVTLQAWFADAEAAEPRVPDAVQVATVGPGGAPRVRTVLLKEFDETGLVFYTNLGSRKAAHLAHDARVALCLHWKSLERQVMVEGTAVQVDDEQADAYWATRPRGSQIGAWASRQSMVMRDRDALVAEVARLDAEYPEVVPRPPFWGGYRVVPHRVEFWQGKPDRLHERIEYTLTDDGWDRVVLFP